MSDTVKPLLKKSLSLQETINLYLKMLPKPPRFKIKQIELIPELKEEKSIHSRTSLKNLSMLKKIDKLIKSSSEIKTQNNKILKSSRSELGINILTPSLIDATSPRTYQGVQGKYRKITNKTTHRRIGVVGSDEKKTGKSRIKKFLSPQHLDIQSKPPGHKRLKSSLDLSNFSLSAWQDNENGHFK
jgi:hypothetical protein